VVTVAALTCDNEHGVQADFMLTTIATGDSTTLCGMCLAQSGLLMFVSAGILTQDQVDTLLAPPPEGDGAEHTEPAPKPVRSRKKAQPKDTATGGESTAGEQHACDVKFNGCTGIGIHPNDAEMPGERLWACDNCYDAISAMPPLEVES
jgi:hypothetical protein